MDEREFKRLRETMVSTQLIPRGIKDQRVIDAMLAVPRHLFVPHAYRHRAYDDCALPTGEGQTISQPYMVAVMSELLLLNESARTLEVGTGSGYQSAVLSLLCREVYSIERMELLYDSARQRLMDLGYDNIVLRHGDGSIGWSEYAPFDRIIVTAGAPATPSPLIEQLAEGGVMIIPVGSEYSQSLTRIKKDNDEIRKDFHTACVFVPLIGRHAWREDSRFRSE